MLIDVHTLLVSLALVIPRTFVCLMILPGFGMRSMTAVTRKAVALAIALPAALPTYYHVQATPPGLLGAGMLIFKEAAIGGLLGVLMSIPMWVAQSIGNILDTQRMPIQIQSNNASIDQDASALGGMMVQAMIMVLIQAGLLVALARILIESYGPWPAYVLMPPFDHGHFDVVLKRFGEFFWHVVVYGGPILIPLLLIDFAFALIGVFASNLQVSFYSSPIKSVVGLFILLVYWPIFSHYVAGDFARMLELSASLLDAAGR